MLERHRAFAEKGADAIGRRPHLAQTGPSAVRRDEAASLQQLSCRDELGIDL